MAKSEFSKSLRKEKKFIEIYINSHVVAQKFDSEESIVEFLDKELEKLNEYNNYKFMQILKSNLDELKGMIQQFSRNNANIDAAIRDIRNKSINRIIIKVNDPIFEYIKAVTLVSPDIATTVARAISRPSEVGIESVSHPTNAYIVKALTLLDIEKIDSNNNEVIISRGINICSELTEKLENVNVEWEDAKNKFNLNVSQLTEDHDDKLKGLFKEHEEELKKLTYTYENKIALDAPAKLWQTKVKKYNSRGWLWSGISVFIGTIVVAGTIVMLINWPNVLRLLLVDNKPLSLETLSRTFLFFGISYGIVIYFIRHSIKLSLSSFHMARDAEERSALTTFYLTLLEDKAINEEQDKELKSIIISALFARVDTGLLKGDNGPTMPTASLNELFRLISGR